MPRVHKKRVEKIEDAQHKEQTGKGKKGGLAMRQTTDEGINPLLGAAVGAGVGAVMGAAAAIALSDRETREKVKEVATNFRDQAAGRLEDMAHKAKETAKVARDDMRHRLQEPSDKEDME